MELSYAENEAIRVLQSQSDSQLEYLYFELNETWKYDGVEYFIMPSNRIAFPIRLTTFQEFVTMELIYREIL